MIIGKDVQDILEGVHHFLSVTLRCERLGVAAESDRRDLVGRLEALARTHPALTLSLPRNPSAASLPYLPMDTPPMLVPTGVQQVHPSESSSGGSNSYSNSSNSGDGLVLAKGVGALAGGASTLPASLRHHHQQQQEEEEEEEEIYEEFDEPDDAPVIMAKMEPQPQQQQQVGVVEAKRDDLDDKEDGEDVYMEAVEAIPFSTIIASCEKHGIVNKRTKGLLRNLKSYHIVAANGRLYLYIRDTDERQRKTIDLTGYTARSATGEDIRDQRKKDSAFEIVGPGKKTHTFVARTARDKQEWLEALARTIKTGRNQVKISPFILTRNANTNLSTPIITAPIQSGHQGKSHTLPTSQGLSTSSSEEYFYYHDVADNEADEVYEEINSEVVCDSLPPPPPSLLSLTPPPSQSPHPSPPLPSQLHSHPSPARPPPSPVPPSLPPPPPPAEELPDYDPVCPANPGPPSLHLSLPKQTPPGRPPLPAVLQDRLNFQTSRPLPDAPPDHGEESDDSVGIYCEIEEDVLETAKEKYLKALESQPGSGDGETTLANGEVKQQGREPPILPARGSGNSLVGFLSDEIFQNISNFGSSPSRFPSSERPCLINTPPKLPPKGIPPAPPRDDDSEYKVPVSMTMDSEYQVPPSNPVPTDPEGSCISKTVHKISRPLQPPSQLYQILPVQTVMSIKPSGKERRNSVVDEQVKPLTSFLTSTEDPYPKNKIKDQVRRFENAGDNKANSEPRPGQGTSVKDMIARLNKNKTTSETQPLKIIEEKSSSLDSTGNSDTTTESVKADVPGDNVFPKPSELKPVKPFIPPRPMNLINGSPEKQTFVSPMLQQQRDSGTGSEAGVCSDDEHYETPEDLGLEVSPHSQGQEMSHKESHTALPATNNTEGDVYVAKFAFVATIDQALSFNRGDEIVVLDTSGNSGWWRASFKGRHGVVPREYLKKKEEVKS